jgi:hypothetical protein
LGLIVKYPLPEIFIRIATNRSKQIWQVCSKNLGLIIKQQNECLKNSRLASVVLAREEIDPLERLNGQVAKTLKIFYMEAS